MGLLPPSAKLEQETSILFDGQELLKKQEKELQLLRGNRIGMIFQEPLSSLNPLHTIGKQIAETLQLHQGVALNHLKKKVVELLERVEIQNAEEKARAYPHELSGGQRQRVMIAMAIANEPDLLIADEPTTALDVTVQAQVLALIRRLQNELGMAILLITHDLGYCQTPLRPGCGDERRANRGDRRDCHPLPKPSSSLHPKITRLGT